MNLPSERDIPAKRRANNAMGILRQNLDYSAMKELIVLLEAEVKQIRQDFMKDARLKTLNDDLQGEQK